MAGINHAKVVDTITHPDDGSPVVGSDFNTDHLITGDVNWASHKITSLADPSSAQDAATKNYVDLASQGVQWKAPVKVATVSAGTLITDFANGQTVDGISLVTGDRILIKDQASGSENGIYIVAVAGAPSRSTDADTSAELIGSTVFAEQGTVNADSAFINTNTSTITIGVTAITYVQFTGAAEITAGNGLSKSGNTLTIDTTITADLSSTQAIAGAKTFNVGKCLIAGAGAGVGTIAYANSGSSATFTIPATTGTAALLAQLTDGTTITGLVNAQCAAGMALAFSKLATLSSANILVGNGSNVATSVAMSGDITIDNTGATTIAANAVTLSKVATAAKTESWDFPLTDETTSPTTGVKYVFGVPYNFTLTGCIVSLTTAGTGATLFTVDVLYEDTAVNTNTFTTIFTTKPTVDASEFTSTTAATPPVLSVTSLSKGRRIQLKINTLDSNTLARGVKVTLVGYQT